MSRSKAPRRHSSESVRLLRHCDMPGTGISRLVAKLSLAIKLRQMDHVGWPSLGQDALTIS